MAKYKARKGSEKPRSWTAAPSKAVTKIGKTGSSSASWLDWQTLTGKAATEGIWLDMFKAEVPSSTTRICRELLPYTDLLNVLAAVLRKLSCAPLICRLRCFFARFIQSVRLLWVLEHVTQPTRLFIAM